MRTPGDLSTGERAALDRELAGSHFCDARLGRRFRRLVGQLASRLGQPIPVACQDWSNTKAAYRFLSNGRVNEWSILAGHFQATEQRAAATGGPILVLHDTTEFTYTRESKQAIGVLRKGFVEEGQSIRPAPVPYRLRHADALQSGRHRWKACRSDWRRSSSGPAVNSKGTNALQAEDQSRREFRSKPRRAFAGWRTCSSPPLCWVNRRAASTSGIVKVTFTNCSAPPKTAARKFLVRTCVDRLADDGQHTIAAVMRRVKVKADPPNRSSRCQRDVCAEATRQVKYQTAAGASADRQSRSDIRP